jgi:hypothetical protein
MAVGGIEGWKVATVVAVGMDVPVNVGLGVAVNTGLGVSVLVGSGVIVGLFVGVGGTGVGGITLTVTVGGLADTSVIPCGITMFGVSSYVPAPKFVTLNVACTSVVVRDWNWAKVPESVRSREVGDSMYEYPSTGSRIMGVTDSCQVVSNVLTLTVTVMELLWPG